MALGHRPEVREEFGAAERQRRSGVGKKILEFGERVGGVERQQRRAGAKAGEREHDRLGRLVDLSRNPVARLDAQLLESTGQTAGPSEQFAIADRLPVRRLRSHSVEVSHSRARIS